MLAASWSISPRSRRCRLPILIDPIFRVSEVLGMSRMARHFPHFDSDVTLGLGPGRAGLASSTISDQTARSAVIAFRKRASREALKLGQFDLTWHSPHTSLK